MRKKIQRPEEVLHLSVVNMLEWSLPKEAVYWCTPNQRGTRKKWEAILLKALGVKPGIPDLWILYQGKLLGPELKAPPKRLKSGKLSNAKPRLSDDQKIMHERLRVAGAVVGVFTSVESVQMFLVSNGVPLRGTILNTTQAR
jgi:hypothetical protein